LKTRLHPEHGATSPEELALLGVGEHHKGGVGHKPARQSVRRGDGGTNPSSRLIRVAILVRAGWSSPSSSTRKPTPSTPSAMTTAAANARTQLRRKSVTASQATPKDIKLLQL
jgi:hypothetical protein